MLTCVPGFVARRGFDSGLAAEEVHANSRGGLSLFCGSTGAPFRLATSRPDARPARASVTTSCVAAGRTAPAPPPPPTGTTSWPWEAQSGRQGDLGCQSIAAIFARAGLPDWEGSVAALYSLAAMDPSGDNVWTLRTDGARVQIRARSGKDGLDTVLEVDLRKSKASSSPAPHRDRLLPRTPTTLLRTIRGRCPGDCISR